MALTSSEFGVQLRECRRIRRLTIRECARRIGISAPYLHDIERGRRAPFPFDTGHYDRIAAELGGTPASWRDLARATKVSTSLTGLPAHIVGFVAHVIQNAADITPERVRRWRGTQ